MVLFAAVVVFPTLFFIDAPYGRFQRKGWGPSMPARWAWVVMESPSVFLFATLWYFNPHFDEPMVMLLGAMWLLHYVQRTFVYPSLMRGAGKPNAVATVGMAIVFNVLNASGNAVALSSRPFDLSFGLGTIVFLVGFVMNVHSDAVLRGLRSGDETGYSIPQHGAHRLVTSPNYLGELLEWVGFALAAQTTASWAFVIFTFANLAPRARAHQRWYREKFADYPPSRKKLVPFIW